MSDGFWNAMISTVIGGGLAIVGTFITLWWTHRRSEEARKAGQLERILAALYEHDHWLDRKRLERCWGEQEEHRADPLSTAFLIASLHIPNLLTTIDRVEAASKKYEVWMLESQAKRLAKQTAEIQSGYNEAYMPYLTAFNAAKADVAYYSKVGTVLGYRMFWRRVS